MQTAYSADVAGNHGAVHALSASLEMIGADLLVGYMVECLPNQVDTTLLYVATDQLNYANNF